MIAEESTAFPGVTMPVEEGGLGFSLKWNMGFANDMFQYLGKEGIYRRYHHAALTFPMLYAYSEKYILPVSHDEVVHGKRSLLEKISERGEEKMELLRAFYLFLMTFPGKKMLFMGSEFGQHGEWCYDRSLDWHLLEEEDHRSLLHYMAALGHFYLATPSLWEQDFSPYGFSWIEADLADQNTVAYRRRAKNGEEILAVISFSDRENRDIRLGAPHAGLYEPVFATDERVAVERLLTEGVGNALTLSLPPRSGVVLRRRREDFIL
jgi:1,4-alpha-glucan branching enzyme